MNFDTHKLVKAIKKTLVFVGLGVFVNAYLIVLSNQSALAEDFITKAKGDVMISGQLLHLAPDEKSVTSIGGTASVDTFTVPIIDARYFVSDNFALETIFGTTKHSVVATGTALGDVDLGSTWVLPFTFTLQYHIKTNTKFQPYVGAGLNYTVFYNSSPGDVSRVTYKDGFGAAFNFGVDYFLSANNYLNLDVKKFKLSTSNVVDAGAAGIATADVDLDPVAISIGYGWRF